MHRKNNEMHMNADACIRMHMNAYGKKLLHFWGKTTMVHHTRYTLTRSRYGGDELGLLSWTGLCPRSHRPGHRRMLRALMKSLLIPQHSFPMPWTGAPLSPRALTRLRYGGDELRLHVEPVRARIAPQDGCSARAQYRSMA